jgi:hypothetical protein
VAALNGPIQKMLVNTELSNQVSSCVGCSMSHARHMENYVLFTKRSCIKTSVRALRDDRRRRFHRVPIGCVARGNGPVGVSRVQHPPPHRAGTTGRCKIDPRGEHGQPGGLACAKTCAAHIEPQKSKSLTKY